MFPYWFRTSSHILKPDQESIGAIRRRDLLLLPRLLNQDLSLCGLRRPRQIFNRQTDEKDANINLHPFKHGGWDTGESEWGEQEKGVSFYWTISCVEKVTVVSTYLQSQEEGRGWRIGDETVEMLMFMGKVSSVRKGIRSHSNCVTVDSIN